MGPPPVKEEDETTNPVLPKIQLHVKNNTAEVNETKVKPIVIHPKKASTTPIKPIKLNVISHKELMPIAPDAVHKDILKPVE